MCQSNRGQPQRGVSERPAPLGEPGSLLGIRSGQEVRGKWPWSGLMEQSHGQVHSTAKTSSLLKQRERAAGGNTHVWSADMSSSSANGIARRTLTVLT